MCMFPSSPPPLHLLLLTCLLFNLHVLPVLSADFFTKGIGCTQFPGYPLCSGKGVCIVEGNSSVIINQPDIPGTRCLCEPGWTGVGDLMNMAGTDCGQNIEGLRAIFGVAIILCLCTFSLSLHRIYGSYKAFSSNVRSGVPRPSGPRLTQARLSVAPLRSRKDLCLSFFRISVVPLAVMSLFSVIATLIYCSVRITDPANEEWVLGRSRITTISRIVEVAFFFSSSSYAAHSWMTMSILMCAVTGKTREEAHEAVVHMKRILFGAIVVGSCLTPFLVLLIHIFPDMVIDGILTLCYLQAAALVGLFLTFAFYSAGKALIDILSKGLECLPADGQKQRKLVIGNISRRFKTSMCTTTITMTLGTLIAWWPMLRAKVTWLIAFVAATNQILLCLSLITLKPPQPQTKPTKAETTEKDLPARPSLEKKSKSSRSTKTKTKAQIPMATSTSLSTRSGESGGDSSPVVSTNSHEPTKTGDSSESATADVLQEQEQQEQQEQQVEVLDAQDEIEVDSTSPTASNDTDSQSSILSPSKNSTTHSEDSSNGSRQHQQHQEYTRLNEETRSSLSTLSGPSSSPPNSQHHLSQPQAHHAPTPSREVSDFKLFVL